MVRSRITRSPLLFWLMVAGLAAFTAVVVARLVSVAGAQAARYGPVRDVVVAVRSVQAGSTLGADDIKSRRLPSTVVPPTALGSVSTAVGRTVVVPVFSGEPVLAAHLAGDKRRGVAALLAPGSRAVAVPLGPASAAVNRGDVVDVLATFDPPAPGAEPTFPVAESARVLDVRSESATVAVDPEEAKRVVFAVAKGAVTLVLTPESGAAQGQVRDDQADSGGRAG